MKKYLLLLIFGFSFISKGQNLPAVLQPSVNAEYDFSSLISDSSYAFSSAMGKYFENNVIVGSYTKTPFGPPGGGNMPENGSFIYKNGSFTTLYNHQSIAVDQGRFFSFNNNNNQQIFTDLNTGNQTLLSLNNPSSGFSHFQISAVNSSRVVGQYYYNYEVNGMQMMTSSMFKGEINGSSINYSLLNDSSLGSRNISDIYGNKAYGTIYENGGSVAKGYILDLDTGQETLLQVPNADATRIEKVSGDYILGMYGIYSGSPMPGMMTYEWRTFVYDGTDFKTLAIPDNGNPANEFKYIGVEDLSGKSILYTDLGKNYVATVPEPSALSLLAVGLGGLAVMRRRRS